MNNPPERCRVFRAKIKSPPAHALIAHHMRQHILATAAVFLVGVRLALAHPTLLSSIPAAGQSVSGPEIDVQLEFNCPIDCARTRLVLSLPDGSVQPLHLRQSELAVLNSRAVALMAGQYRLQWQVLSADGHIEQGEVPFTVQ